MADPIQDRTHLSVLRSSSHRKTSSTSPDFLLEVSTSLQKRDRQICLALYHHRVLTTHQIKELFFENDRVCRRRLAKLKELGLVKTFRPTAYRGSNPNHYLLGDLGVYLVAAEKGVEAKHLGIRKDRMTSIAFSPRLQHQLDVNSFFSGLAWACRHTPGMRLRNWKGEMAFGDKRIYYTRPDGEGWVSSPYWDIHFFLELDRGTENLDRIGTKLGWYDHMWKLDGFPQHWLLFCFLSPTREINFHKSFDGTGVPPLATSVLSRHLADPLGDNWLCERFDDRFSLAETPETGWGSGRRRERP